MVAPATFPLTVCGKCKSDMVTYTKNKKRVKCLNCGKTTKPQTVWIIKQKKMNQPKRRITIIKDEKGNILKKLGDKN